MISALVQGELAADPMERTTQAGRPFWTVNFRIPAGSEALFIGLATFSDTAGERLMKLRKGSRLAAAGVLEQTQWTDRQGTARTGWRLTASEVLTVYEATKKRREQTQEGEQ